MPADVESIFADALDVPPDQRRAFLDARCAGQPQVRLDVESLLQAHDTAGDFLDLPAIQVFADELLISTTDPLVGRRIGAFTLEERIGQGGMGVVYRGARQDGDFAQRVAIKVVDILLRRPDVPQRFKSERQILASLSHPHIVGLVDGGVTPEGQAYLVMEYVEGVPITTYCATNRVSLDHRLALVADVCGAVQYAHQHGVVHRDLKPANILVTPDGVPKVLDFGIAKLLRGATDATGENGDEADAAFTTAETGVRPLTPNYASPEQLRGQPVTTASDIYALGVLLYELLVGAPPYQLNAASLEQMLHVVVDLDPPRPSSVAGPGSVPYASKVLRGDLDAIVLKAMRKSPAERYASARELAEDLDRCQHGRPVVAREPSLGYLLARTARRHRAGFTAAGVSILALVVALGVSLWQTRIARAENTRANARFKDARDMAEGVIFKLERNVSALPGSAPLRQQIVSEALSYLERLSQDPAGDDALIIDLAKGYHRVGDIQGNPTFPNLGDRSGALKSIGRAIELLVPLAARPSPPRLAMLELASAKLSVASIQAILDHRDETRRSVEEASAICRALVKKDPRDHDARRELASSEFSFALLEQSSGGDDLSHWQAAGDMFESLLADAPDTSDSRRNIALVQKYIGSHYERLANFTAALPHFLRAKDIDEARLAARADDRTAQFDVAIDLSNVANSQLHTGHVEESAATYEKSLAMRQRLVTFDPSDVLARSRVAFVHTRLSVVYGQLGRYELAVDHAHQAVKLAESMAGLDVSHRVTFAEELIDLAFAEARAGDQTSACVAFQRSSDAIASVQTNPDTLSQTRASVDRLADQITRGLKACK